MVPTGPIFTPDLYVKKLVENPMDLSDSMEPPVVATGTMNHRLLSLNGEMLLKVDDRRG